VNEQPKALQLAAMAHLGYRVGWQREAAAELRRLHAENERLHRHELAAEQWIDKTDWVQKTSQPEEIGMHRADVLKQRIERLHAENAELLEALKRAHTWLQGSEPGRAQYLGEVIAKAEGEQT